MKELQFLAELINVATKEGVYDMNQIGNAITAINTLSKELSNGIIPEKNEENGPAKEKKAGPKNLKNFGKTLEAMNYVFHQFKDLDKVTPDMINSICPVKLSPDVVEMLIKDIEEYESKT